MKQTNAEELRHLLDYNRTTGEFIRRVAAPCSPVGRIVGNAKSNGYVHISVYNKKYYAHRLAWLHVHGVWPTGDIDHIDGVRTNNALSNLRDVSRSVNLENIKSAKSHNKSTRILGAYPCGNRFTSRIQVHGVNKYLGVFLTADLAHAAYMAAKRELHQGNTL